MTDRGRSQKYYERVRSYSSDRSWKYYDRNKTCKRDGSPKYYKNDYEKEYYSAFQDHRNRRKYKDHFKDKYRDENFYDSDRSYDMDYSHGRDRAYDRNRWYSRDRDNSWEYKGDRSLIRDRLYDRNGSYNKDKLWDYYRNVYKMENHKYKRRSRDYHENRCEDGYVNEYNDSYRDRNKYKHQYRNDRYDKIRSRLKEKPCSHGDKNCDSSHSELEELYKTLPLMTSEEATAIRSMLMTSEYTNKVMDSTCLMAARVK